MTKQMSNSEIYTVYSKKNCSFCVRAVHLIENQGLKVQLKKIDEVKEYLLEMKTVAPSMRTMPVILKGNNLIGGYSDLVEYFS